MKKIVFYCSGGGYGHMARSDAAIYHLSRHGYRVVLASKEKQWPFSKYTNFRYVQLTNVDARARFYDDKIKTQIWHGQDNDLKPYQRHVLEFLSLLERERPDVVVVDSTPEIALFVKMLGYKMVYVYETLEMAKPELRFDLAWKNADKVIFTYPKYFADTLGFGYPNTSYCGGYTRMENGVSRDRKEIVPGSVLVSFGKGEKSEDTLSVLLEKLSEKFKDISVLSGSIDIRHYSRRWPAVKFVKNKQKDVLKALSEADIYVCGAGYNTLMEGFYLGKRIVTLPLERPYGEQLIKAKIFEKHGALEMLLPDRATHVNDAIVRAMDVPEDKLLASHGAIVAGDGAAKAAGTIMELTK